MAKRIKLVLSNGALLIRKTWTPNSNMISSLELTDNSLDDNIMDYSLPVSDKFSILNTTSLTTPPPESVSSPDLSYTTYEVNEKLANEISLSTLKKETKKKTKTKRQKKNFFKLNQYFIRNHISLRENLEGSYKRFKAIKENFNKTEIVKNRCMCKSDSNENCIFCKLINISPIQSQIADESNQIEIESLQPSITLNDLINETKEFNQIDNNLNENSKEQKIDRLKKFFCSDDEIDTKNMYNLLFEIATQDLNEEKNVKLPYFYSEGMIWEGISLSQDESDKFDEIYGFNDAKRRKIKDDKENKQSVSKQGRFSFVRTDRRLSHLSETVNLTETRRLRKRSARSNSSSSTRSSNPSNEVCSASLNTDKFDINNIFIPNEIISCQKITPFQTHKITTPKWRELIIESSIETQSEEMLDDMTFCNRHKIRELKEKLNLTNKKKLDRPESLNSIDELKSLLIKINPRLVEEHDENSNSITKSTIEWPERIFPLNDYEYENMLKMDNQELS